MNILLLGNPNNFHPVWFSAQNHLDFIQNCGKKITVIIRSEFKGGLNDSWITSFRADNIITYNNYADLFVLLRKQVDKKFFCLTWKEILIIKTLMLFKGCDTYYWYQGIVPEEDFLRTKNHFRKRLLKIVEWLGLKISDKQILVSSYMKEYLEKTRNLKLKNILIIPCTSNLIYHRTNRTRYSFAYVGSLLAWQRVDRILKMFDTIVAKFPESHLYLITYDVDEAVRLVNIYISRQFRGNVICKSIKDRQKIAELLSSVEYGFLIRDDDPINNVASPIKLAEYLSCGVNVILSNSVISYTKLITEKECGIIIDKDIDIENIFNYKPCETCAIEAYNEMFNRETLINNYRNFIYSN